MPEDKKAVLDTEKLGRDLKKIISEIAGVRVSAIENSTDLRGDLGIDSFSAIEILVAIEQRYGIVLNKSQVFNVKTFKDVLNLAQKHIQKR